MIRVRKTTILASLLALAAAAAYAATPSPQQVLANVHKTYSSLKTLEVRGVSSRSMTIDGKKRAQSAKYHVVFQRPAKLRNEVGEGKDQVVAVTDGKNLHMIQARTKQYATTPIKDKAEVFRRFGGPGASTMALLGGADFSKAAKSPRIAGSARIAGTDCYILQFGLGPDGKAIQKLWVGKGDWLVRRNELTISTVIKGKGSQKSVNVSESTSATISSIHPNVTVKPATFAFAHPRGYTKFDPKKAAEQMKKAVVEQRKKIDQVGDALEGKAAPSISLKDIDGKSVSLASMKGKVVLLNFCLTKHPISQMQIGVLQKLYDSQHSRGLEVLIVSADSKVSDIKSFAAGKKISIPITTGNKDQLKAIGTAYRLVVLPTTYIVNRSGKITEHFVGNMNESTLKSALGKAGL